MTETALNISVLTSHGVLELRGADRKTFLQGLVTNEMSALGPGAPLYAAMLTPQGKYLFDFLIHEDGEALYLDCEAARMDDLIRRLTMYKLRSDVEIVDATGDWAVVAAWGADSPPLPEGCIGGTDPRHPKLGWRGLCPAGTVTDVVTANEDDYDLHRLTLGVPDSARDMEAEKLLILEGNLAELNGVSFTKGCYVGQELTARMNYRGKVRKRLLPVTVDGPLPAPGTEVTSDGKAVGQIRSGRSGRALALLRVEDIEDGGSYICGEATLTVSVPDWLRAKVIA